MANEQNLKRGNPGTQFRSGREAVENGAKGGKKSGVSRGFRKTVMMWIKENPDKVDLMVNNLVEKALDGDLKAFELLIELAGESPKQMDLKIKRDELKFRKEKDW